MSASGLKKFTIYILILNNKKTMDQIARFCQKSLLFCQTMFSRRLRIFTSHGIFTFNKPSSLVEDQWCEGVVFDVSDPLFIGDPRESSVGKRKMETPIAARASMRHITLITRRVHGRFYGLYIKGNGRHGKSAIDFLTTLFFLPLKKKTLQNSGVMYILVGDK